MYKSYFIKALSVKINYSIICILLYKLLYINNNLIILIIINIIYHNYIVNHYMTLDIHYML